MEDPRALLAKADKQLASAQGGFSLFGGRGEKMEAAAELYVQAANAFKVQKLHSEAGAAFEKAAAVQTKINEPDDAANSQVEAYKAYKKADPAAAARTLETAIKHYTMRGNFRRAATYQQQLAELYEAELADTPRAIQAYEIAGDWFSGDNAEALANKVYLKVADLAATEGDYAKACERFEGVAKNSVGNNLMKWSLKDYFLKAGICHLCTGDLVTTKRKIAEYAEMDMSFPTTREYMLLNDITQAYEEGNPDRFAECVFQFDQMSKLDRWKTTLLLKIKNSIEGTTGGENGEEMGEPDLS